MVEADEARARERAEAEADHRQAMADYVRALLNPGSCTGEDFAWLVGHLKLQPTTIAAHIEQIKEITAARKLLPTLPEWKAAVEGARERVKHLQEELALAEKDLLKKSGALGMATTARASLENFRRQLPHWFAADNAAGEWRLVGESKPSPAPAPAEPKAQPAPSTK
jgi:hypothetical protein